MPTEFQESTLRRWAAGKHLTKAQLEDLLDAGLIYTTDNGTRATTRGVAVLQKRKDHQS